MTSRLFDDEVVRTERTLAKSLITKGLGQPHYRLRIDRFDRAKKSLHVKYLKKTELNYKELDNLSFLDVPGLYAIFEGEPSSDNCLYVGFSGDSVRYRLYRFMKELKDISRKDESHPAAKKCRRAYVNADNICVKFLPAVEIPNGNIKIRFIDEWLAPMINSRYNKRVKK